MSVNSITQSIILSMVCCMTGIVLAQAPQLNTDTLNIEGLNLTEAQSAKLIELTMQQLDKTSEEDCDNAEALECLSISKTTCMNAKRDVMTRCTLPLMKEIRTIDQSVVSKLDLVHAQCAMDIAKNQYDIDAERYLACLPEDAYDDTDAVKRVLQSRAKN